MAASTLTTSSLAFIRSSSLGPGLSTHRMTNNPIMHMMRSANVKIHSGHSSQISWGSHFLQDAAMGEMKRVHRRDAESAERAKAVIRGDFQAVRGRDGGCRP